MSFKDQLDEVSKDMNTESDFYKFKDGDNKLRILTEPTIQVSRFGYGICYEGAAYCQQSELDKEYERKMAEAKSQGKDPKKVSRPMLTKKWMAWAIDRSNGKLVIVTLPYRISKSLREHMDSEESGFEGFPMPYDINIKAKNAGTKEVEYEFIASRKDTPVTKEELHELEGKTPVDQILDRMKSRSKERYEQEHTAPKTQEELEAEEAEQNLDPDAIPF